MLETRFYTEASFELDLSLLSHVLISLAPVRVQQGPVPELDVRSGKIPLGKKDVLARNQILVVDVLLIIHCDEGVDVRRLELLAGQIVQFGDGYDVCNVEVVTL